MAALWVPRSICGSDRPAIMTAAPCAAGFAGLVRAGLALAALVSAGTIWAADKAGADAALPVSAPADPAPDYTQADVWAVRDGNNGSTNRKADVFYIHPTTFQSQEWNQRLADAATRNWTRASVVDRQLSAFSACCRRFMPWYRQASSRAFVERAGRGAAAYDFAYADIRAAFRHYLARDNHGRPFILAGHSQGALLGLRLLQDEIAGSAAARRLVVAYLPGIGIPAGALPPGITACQRPAQSRCVVSWNSFTLRADTTAWAARAQHDYAVPGRDQSIICINPLTFSANRPAAPAAASKGWLPVARPGNPPSPMAIKAVSAACENGVLRIATTISPPAPLPGGILHMHDIALFWGDIAANARLRIRAFQAAAR